MVSLTTPAKARLKLADNVRRRRLRLALTQQGLAERSGVPLATLRKFEQKGLISLDSFLKLLLVVGGLNEVIEASEPKLLPYSSIDEVLADTPEPERQRGNRK